MGQFRGEMDVMMVTQPCATELSPAGGNGTHNVTYISPALNDATRSVFISDSAGCDSRAVRAP